jgi:hypothetical protein
MSLTVGSGRILIIASYNGSRHYTRGLTPAQMLRIQSSQLSKLKNDLNRVLLVVNEAQPDPDYDKALMLFQDQIKIPNSNQGSYGAWRDGFFDQPDFEWYFFLEDDYTFFLDSFDQLMIDMWSPGTSYLANKVDGNYGEYGQHASISNGLIKGETLRSINWDRFDATSQYGDAQICWSRLFDLTGLKDITHLYAHPFWTGADLIWTDSPKPTLIGPMQLLQ